MFGQLDPDECMAAARRAAAGVHRLIPALAPYKDDVTQNAYLAMLEALRDGDHTAGNMYAYIYLCCRRDIIQGWIQRNDYRFRRVYHLELTDKMPELGHVESPEEAATVHELLDAAGLSKFERLTITEYFWAGRNTREIGEHLGYTGAWARESKNLAINKMRHVMGMEALPPSGQRNELSMTRGARSMRKVARERLNAA